MTAETRASLFACALVAASTLAYTPMLGAGFLGYDDDWLIERSPAMADASPAALGAIVTAFDRDTRLVLGAEYLPVRDVVVWTAVRLLGGGAPALRVLQLALFIVGVLAMRAWLRALWRSGAIGRESGAEIAALVFALHPVHAESVAWLAGMKDVLALAFSAMALVAYARAPTRGTRALVGALTFLACFSKAVSVVLPLLLLLHDALVGRRPDRATLTLATLTAALAATVHISVGATVGMVQALPGGTRLTALATMAPVALRYALRVIGLEPGSVVYDVPERTLTDPVALAALAALVAAVVAVLVAARRGARTPALTLAWFFVALLPVSQVLAPLQNRMADRYLLLALAGPCLALGVAVSRVPPSRWATGAALGLVGALLVATAVRAQTFADPTALFLEATERAPSSAIGPYQLGVLVENEHPEEAEAAFREALRRDPLRSPIGRRAANNLAILLARSGRTEEALAQLEAAHARFPADPRVGNNLAVLRDDAGGHEAARQLLLEVMERAPHYAAARATYAARFGEPPPAPPSASRFGSGER